MQAPPTRSSSPADPSEVSFLTTLPHEIRNYVYKWLFKGKDAVLLHNVDVFHEPCHEIDSERALADYYNGFDDEPGASEEAPNANAIFQHEFHEGLALLSSCRQIYDEASGILYGGNTFVFSRVLHRHDERDDTEDKDKEYFPVKYAGQWLNKIGSQFSRLRKVIIDADAICGWNGCEHGTDIDFLPLLRLVWKNPGFLQIVSFGSMSRILRRLDFTNDAADERRAPRIDGALMLNNLLTAFAVDDVLDIRKYSFSNRLMSAVCIILYPKWGGDGYVHEPIGRGVSWCFQVSNNGQSIQWEPPEENYDPFGNLPAAMRERIAEFALSHSSQVMIDLDTHTIRGVDFGLARTGLIHERTLGKLTARLKHTTLKMKSKKAIADFAGFKSLQSLFFTPHHEHVLQEMIRSWHVHNPLTLMLEIAPSRATALTTIRINVKPLMILLRTRRLHPDSTIRITLTPSPHIGVPQQVTTISTTKLQRQVFLLLSDIILQADEELCECPGPSTVHAILDEMTPFPNLWLDGRGRLLQASSEAMAAPLKFEYSKLSVKELNVAGYSRAESMDWMYKAFLEEDKNITLEHVVHVLRDLRNLLYGDWNSRVVPSGLDGLAP